MTIAPTPWIDRFISRCLAGLALGLATVILWAMAIHYVLFGASL